MKFIVEGGKDEETVRGKVYVDDDGDLRLALSMDGNKWADILYIGTDGAMRRWSYGVGQIPFIKTDSEGRIQVKE